MKVIVPYMYIFRDYKFYFECEIDINVDAVRDLNSTPCVITVNVFNYARYSC